MRQCCSELNLEEGDFLTELVCEKELLQQNTEEQSSLELTLEGLNHTVSAIFHLYKEANKGNTGYGAWHGNHEKPDRCNGWKYPGRQYAWKRQSFLC